MSRMDPRSPDASSDERRLPRASPLRSDRDSGRGGPSDSESTGVDTEAQAGTDPLGDLPLEHALHLVARGIPETAELWRAGWWLESMLAPGLEIVSVEELERRYREREMTCPK